MCAEYYYSFILLHMYAVNQARACFSPHVTFSEYQQRMGLSYQGPLFSLEERELR